MDGPGQHQNLCSRQNETCQEQGKAYSKPSETLGSIRQSTNAISSAKPLAIPTVTRRWFSAHSVAVSTTAPCQAVIISSFDG